MTLRMETERWSASEKVLFRFGLLYFAFYIFPYPLPRFEALAWLWRPFYELKGSIVHTLGVRLLSLPEQRTPIPGRGDLANDYVSMAMHLALALVGTLLWSWLDRRRPHYRSLAYWATVGLRFYLGYTMLEYGIIKILKSQFPLPGPAFLATALGDLPAMRLLWLTMGASTTYCMFVGCCEFLGGALLFFRRTLLAGALLTFGVMLNVVLMNALFGVHVLMFSAHLLLLAGLLILPDAGRVLAVVLGGAAPAQRRERPSMSPRLGRALSAIKLVLVAGLFTSATAYGHGAWYTYGDAAPKPPLYGVWDVESFTRAGQLVPVDAGDAQRWSWLGIDSERRSSIQRAKGPPTLIRVAIDPSASRLELFLQPGSSTAVSFRYAQPEPGVLELEGELDGAPTSIRLRERPLEQFQLITHRFRWTSDL
jgi:hypothetical protein